MFYNSTVKIEALGDSDVIIKFSENISKDVHIKVKSFCKYLDKHHNEHCYKNTKYVKYKNRLNGDSSFYLI